MMLIDVPEGIFIRIVSYRAGRRASFRLMEMGMIIGEKIKIITKQPYGPVLVEVKDSRIAIGRGLAMKIIVEEIKK